MQQDSILCTCCEAQGKGMGRVRQGVGHVKVIYRVYKLLAIHHQKSHYLRDNYGLDEVDRGMRRCVVINQS